MKRLLLLSLALLILPACQSAPEQSTILSASLQRFSSETLGVSFDYPNDWAIESSESEVELASSADILSGEEAYSEGVRITVFAAPSTAFDSDLIASLDQLVGFMTEDETVTVDQEPELTTINGQEGAMLRLAALENEVPVYLSASILRNEDQVAVVLSLYDQENAAEHQQTVDSIVNSVMVFAPAEG